MYNELPQVSLLVTQMLVHEIGRRMCEINKGDISDSAVLILNICF